MINTMPSLPHTPPYWEGPLSLCAPKAGGWNTHDGFSCQEHGVCPCCSPSSAGHKKEGWLRQGNKSKSAGSPSLDKSKVEFGIRAAFIRGLIKRSDLSVRLRKGNKTPKGCKCAEAFAHFLTSLARSKKLVGQVVYHTNSVSLEAVLADDRDWGGVKGGVLKPALQGRGFNPTSDSLGQCKCDSQSSIWAIRKEVSQDFINICCFQCIPHIQVFRGTIYGELQDAT